jgi:hypothetical protein
MVSIDTDVWSAVPSVMEIMAEIVFVWGHLCPLVNRSDFGVKAMKRKLIPPVGNCLAISVSEAVLWPCHMAINVL